MQLSSEISHHEVSISTHCLVVFTHPEAKTKEELLDCFCFDLPKQDHASGLMGSVPVGPSPSDFVWDDMESDPKKILQYINNFFGERRNREMLKKKWLFVVLFDRLIAQVNIKYQSSNTPGVQQPISIDRVIPTRQSYALFRPNADGVKKYFTTYSDLEKAVLQEIQTNTHKDIYTALSDENFTIKVL